MSGLGNSQTLTILIERQPDGAIPNYPNTIER